MHLSEPMDTLDIHEDWSWHVLYTRHQHEKVIAQALLNKGFEVFLPLYSTTHRWKDRNKQVSLPLFPSYVFLRGGMNRQYEIATTPGIHMLLMTAGRAAVVPEGEINTVRRLVDSCEHLGPHPFLYSGEWVRVKSGALAGAEGVLVRRKNDIRLIISIKMLGKSAATEVDASIVEPINPPEFQELVGPPEPGVWMAA